MKNRNDEADNDQDNGNGEWNRPIITPELLNFIGNVQQELSWAEVKWAQFIDPGILNTWNIIALNHYSSI